VFNARQPVVVSATMVAMVRGGGTWLKTLQAHRVHELEAPAPTNGFGVSPFQKPAQALKRGDIPVAGFHRMLGSLITG
jgi:hypothetical protein